MNRPRVDRRVLAATALVVVVSAGWRVVREPPLTSVADAPRPIAMDAGLAPLVASLDAEIDRLAVRGTAASATPAVRNPFSVAPAVSPRVSVTPSAAPAAAAIARAPVPPVLIAILTTEHDGHPVKRAAVEVAHRVSVVEAGDTVGTFVLAEIGPSAVRWTASDGTVIEQPTGWPHSRHRIFTPAR